LDTTDAIVAAILRSWSRIEPARAPRAAALDQNGWDRLADVAIREGVAGLVHRALSRDPCGVLVPPWVRDRMQAVARRQAAAHAWEEAALGEVLDAFHSRGLRPVLLRGHGLVATLYGSDGSLRPQLDHDLLVERGRIDDAREVLRSLGFESNPGSEDVLTRDTTTIDLHWDPYDRPRVPSRGKVIRADAQAVIERAVPITVAGRTVLQPCPTDRVLLLCVHLVKHSFDRLIRMVDIAECCRKFRLDAARLVEQAANDGTADAAYYGLAASAARAGAPAGALLARMEPHKRLWIDRAFEGVLRGGSSPFFAERLLLSQLTGWGDRLLAVKELLWTPEERARLSAESTSARLVAVPHRVATLARRIH
jgi:hypothetical protein